MTRLTSTALRIAYTAVRLQRANADIKKMWIDEEMREAYLETELVLAEMLREADREKEVVARGGEKQKFV